MTTSPTPTPDAASPWIRAVDAFPTAAPFQMASRRQRRALIRSTSTASPTAATPVTPASIASRPQAVLSAVPPLAVRRERERRERDEHGGVEVAPGVRGKAAYLGIATSDVIDAVLAPERTWPSKHGNATVHLRGPVAAIVADDDGYVVAIAGRQSALDHMRSARSWAHRRSSGGSGNRFPTSIDDLLSRARAAGFTVTMGGKHWHLGHASLDGIITVPTSPSDWRSIPNSVLAIRRQTGIDLRSVTPSARGIGARDSNPVADPGAVQRNRS